MKQEFEMTQEQFDEIIDACKTVPMIMIQRGNTRTKQENANDAWERLGKVMGFNHMSVKPSGSDLKKFFADEV